MKNARLNSVWTLLGAWCSATVAIAADQAPSRSLTDLSLEELMNEPVTSVAKKSSTVFESPAAITVVTGDELIRFGVETLPDALRFVPGLAVGEINSHVWAISARGFAGQFADKMLVMIDTRTVYEPTFAGVRWNLQDTVIDDIDRIEVIRGPGATLWGANALNGVVNITTKSAKETQGWLVSTSGGTDGTSSTSIRYGGAAGSRTFYRAYLKYFNSQALELAGGDAGPDDWRGLRAGFRTDTETAASDILTTQGEVYGEKSGQFLHLVDLTPPFGRDVTIDNFNSSSHLQARWIRTFDAQSHFAVQAYYTHTHSSTSAARIVDDMADLSVEHRFAPARDHDVIWGAGLRYIADDLPSDAVASFTPESSRMRLYSAFLEDDVTILPDRLRASIGSKFEHNDQTGFEVQPSARVWWTPAPNHALWASASRAVRTPDRFERGVRQLVGAFPFPTGQGATPALMAIVGNPGLRAERLETYELGYRHNASSTFSADFAAFYNRYDRLIGFVSQPPVFEPAPLPPHFLFALKATNVDRDNSYGAEATLHWQPMPAWQLTGSYAWLRSPVLPNESEFDSPAQQVQLRSTLQVRPDLTSVAALWYVDRLSVAHIPSYVRADIGLIWSLTRWADVGLWGRNLFDRRHAEFNSVTAGPVEYVPRSLVLRVSCRF